MGGDRLRRGTGRHVAAVLGAALSLHAAAARADDELCPAGQQISASTAGHCCWPEQQWDDAQQICSGKPACPAGTTRNGLVCMATKPSAPVRRHPTDPAVPVADAELRTGDSPPPPATRGGSGNGLIIGGAVTFGVGYLIAIASAGVGTAISSSDGVQYGGSCARSAPWAFVPLIGPFITLANYPQHQIASYRSGLQVLDCKSAQSGVTALVLTDELLQLGGAAMLAAGIALKRGAGTPQAVGSASIEVLPGAPSAPLGVSVVVTTF